jgi:choline dehydrogenase-like flavoprotein
VGARYTAQYELDDLVADPRYKELKILPQSPATRILMRSRRQAAGVEYLDSNGKPQSALADRVVICSGTYESPKLLLLSENIFWPKGVGNDSDLVGKYITSHSILGVKGKLDRNDECWFQEYDFPTLMSRTYDTPEYQQHGKLFIFKNRKEPSFDFADKMVDGLTKNQIEAELRKERRQELQAFLEEKGSEGNRLTIADGKNRWGLPNTRVHFDRTSADLADAHSRLALMERVIKTMGYEIEYSKVEDPGGHHASGTCRMAEHPEHGVTDADLRVHGTDNLYICSNAVLPSGSAVNPTLTLTALAMRLGDHLVGATARPVARAAESAAAPARATASTRESPSVNLNESVFG